MKKTLISILLTIICIVMPFLINGSSIFLSYANTIDFDNINVLDDLRSSSINGEPFSLYDYPVKANGEYELINFVEYCYSPRSTMLENYGLYVYIYNPSLKNINTSTLSNKIQMAVDYDDTGSPINYEKFVMDFCSTSVDTGYYKLFYKFKVRLINSQRTSLLNRLDSSSRRYDISGIELLEVGEQNAHEFDIGGSFVFTGYSAGYGFDVGATSTLVCDIELLESVELDVQKTYYRTQTSSKGAGYQNQLDSVYFSVPEKYFEKYGSLQRIKAEWYEYKTRDIIVTSNTGFYTAVYPYIGVPHSTTTKPNGGYTYNSDIGYSLGYNAMQFSGSAGATAKWGWNLGNYQCATFSQTLYYLFHTNNIGNYDPYNYQTQGAVSSNDLTDYIYNYNKTSNSGYMPIKNGTISMDLFESDIDEYRKINSEYGQIKQGYSYYDFDIDVDLHTLLTWQDTDPSFWDNLVSWGLFDSLFGTIPDEKGRTVPPICVLDEVDLNDSDKIFSENLLINISDVQNIKSKYDIAKKNNERIVLFRFAASDYYSADIDIVQIGADLFGLDKYISNQTYRSMMSVFLDFDVIQLTFCKDGDYMVIPAVSSPVDVVDGVTPPLDIAGDDILQTLLMIVGLILAVAFIITICPSLLTLLVNLIVWLVRFVVLVITLPFKMLCRRK